VGCTEDRGDDLVEPCPVGRRDRPAVMQRVRPRQAQRLRAGEERVTSLLSTPAYVPPEMAAGFTGCAASDIFQLGILLYELLSGNHPFATEDFSDDEEARESQLIRYALASLHNAPRLDGPGLERGPLRELLAAMMDRAPHRRPTAVDVEAALGRFY